MRVLLHHHRCRSMACCSEQLLSLQLRCGVTQTLIRIVQQISFKHRFTLRTSLSQNPPHQGARSIMNCQSTCLFARYCFTSLDLEIFLTSTDADLKVFALSVNNFGGSPLRLTNLRNACKKDVTVKLSVNSRWTARVDAHVNRQQYALLRFSGDAELT